MILFSRLLVNISGSSIKFINYSVNILNTCEDWERNLHLSSGEIVAAFHSTFHQLLQVLWRLCVRFIVIIYYLLRSTTNIIISISTTTIITFITTSHSQWPAFPLSIAIEIQVPTNLFQIDKCFFLSREFCSNLHDITLFLLQFSLPPPSLPSSPSLPPSFLSIYLSIYLSICLPTSMSVCLSVCLSLYPSIDLSIHPSIHPSILIYLSTVTYMQEHNKGT